MSAEEDGSIILPIDDRNDESIDGLSSASASTTTVPITSQSENVIDNRSIESTEGLNQLIINQQEKPINDQEKRGEEGAEEEKKVDADHDFDGDYSLSLTEQNNEEEGDTEEEKIDDDDAIESEKGMMDDEEKKEIELEEKSMEEEKSIDQNNNNNNDNNKENAEENEHRPTVDDTIQSIIDENNDQLNNHNEDDHHRSDHDNDDHRQGNDMTIIENEKGEESSNESRHESDNAMEDVIDHDYASPELLSQDPFGGAVTLDHEIGNDGEKNKQIPLSPLPPPASMNNDENVDKNNDNENQLMIVEEKNTIEINTAIIPLPPAETLITVETSVIESNESTQSVIKISQAEVEKVTNDHQMQMDDEHQHNEMMIEHTNDEEKPSIGEKEDDGEKKNAKEDWIMIRQTEENSIQMEAITEPSTPIVDGTPQSPGSPHPPLLPTSSTPHPLSSPSSPLPSSTPQQQVTESTPSDQPFVVADEGEKEKTETEEKKESDEMVQTDPQQPTSDRVNEEIMDQVKDIQEKSTDNANAQSVKHPSIDSAASLEHPMIDHVGEEQEKPDGDDLSVFDLPEDDINNHSSSQPPAPPNSIADAPNHDATEKAVETSIMVATDETMIANETINEIGQSVIGSATEELKETIASPTKQIDKQIDAEADHADIDELFIANENDSGAQQKVTERDGEQQMNAMAAEPNQQTTDHEKEKNDDGMQTEVITQIQTVPQQQIIDQVQPVNAARTSSNTDKKVSEEKHLSILPVPPSNKRRRSSSENDESDGENESEILSLRVRIIEAEKSAERWKNDSSEVRYQLYLLNKSHSELEEKNKRLQTAADAATTEQDRLRQSALMEINKLHNERNAAHKKYEEESATNRLLQKERDESKYQLSEMQKSFADINQQKQKLERELNAVRQSWILDRSSLEQKVNALQNEYQQFSSQHAKQVAVQFDQQIVALTNQLNQLNAERDNFLSTNNQLNIMIAEATAAKQSLDDRLRIANEDNDRVNSELMKIKREKDNAIKNMKTAENRLNEMERELSRYQKELNEARSHAATIDDDYNKIRAELNKNRRELEGSNEKLEQAIAQLEETERALKVSRRSEQEYDVMKKKLEDANRLLNQRQDDVMAANRSMKGLKEEYSMLQKRHDSVKKYYEDELERSAKLSKQIKDLETPMSPMRQPPIHPISPISPHHSFIPIASVSSPMNIASFSHPSSSVASPSAVPAPRKYRITFSGFRADGGEPSISKKEQLMNQALALGDCQCLTDPDKRTSNDDGEIEAVKDCTHVICSSSNSSTFKALGARILGKWVMTADWIEESAKAGRWLSEDSFAGIRSAPFDGFRGKKILMHRPSLDGSLEKNKTQLAEKLIVISQGEIRNEASHDIDYIITNQNSSGQPPSFFGVSNINARVMQWKDLMTLAVPGWDQRKRRNTMQPSNGNAASPNRSLNTNDHSMQISAAPALGHRSISNTSESSGESEVMIIDENTKPSNNHSIINTITNTATPSASSHSPTKKARTVDIANEEKTVQKNEPLAPLTDSSNNATTASSSSGSAKGQMRLFGRQNAPKKKDDPKHRSSHNRSTKK